MRYGWGIGLGILLLALPAAMYPAAAGTGGGNILIVVADDLGMDILSCFGEGADPYPPTPNICALARDGVRFRNTWAFTVCSPSRAALLTGRYPHTTGIGSNIAALSNTLPFGEVTLPETLALLSPTYETAAIGKWHLGNCLNGDRDSPGLAGFPHFAGAERNLSDYFDWLKTTNGVKTPCSPGSPGCPSSSYATTVNVDDALDWIEARAGPWFLFLAFNAPHEPFQAPPDGLHSYHGVIRDNLPVAEGEICIFGHDRPCYLATVEAMDREIGRLLSSMDPAMRDQTTVIFVGDNGTPGRVTAPPFQPDHAKTTLYEGGINVPMIIAGPAVVNPGREARHLVSTVDLFPTVLELAGVVDPGPSPGGQRRDGVSLMPILQDPLSGQVRSWVFSEAFGADIADARAIRGNRFKLLERQGAEEFYDLELDPFEQDDLLQLPELDALQQMNLDRLRSSLDGLFEVAPCRQESYCTDCAACSASSDCSLKPTNSSVCRQATGALLQCAPGLELYLERCRCSGTTGCDATDAHYLCL